MLRRKVLLGCSAILLCVCIYLYINQEGIQYTYKERGSLPIHTNTVTITPFSVLILACIVFIAGKTFPKNWNFNRKKYRELEKKRKAEQQKQFERYKNRKYN